MAARIAILSESRLFREGLAGLLRASPCVDVVALAARVAEAAECIARERPDVLLLDMAMPDALGQLRPLTDGFGGLKIVALGVAETASDVIACAEAGVAGYVPREASIGDLIGALQAAERGELRCSVSVAAALLRRVTELARARGRAGDHPAVAKALTLREVDVLRLLEAGHSNKDIACTLGIELATAKNHVHHVLEKLGVRGRAQAVAVASRWLPRSATVGGAATRG